MRSFVLALGFGVLAVACGHEAERAETSSDDLTGSVSNARGCAVKKAYGAAELDDLTLITKADLPTPITTSSPTSLSKMLVASVGDVFVIEEGPTTSFYDRNGSLVARATNATPMIWSGANGGSLSCDGEEPSTETPPPVVKQLVAGADAVLMAVVGDDAIYRQLPTTTGSNTEVFAVPLAGGSPTRLFTLRPTDTTAIAGRVIAHWSGVESGVGDLEVWTRATGVKSVATGTLASLIRASADGTRIAYGASPTSSSGTKPSSAALAVRDLASATDTLVADGPYRMNLASTSCVAQISFAGGRLFAEYCSGAEPTQTRARLVTLAPGSSSLRRLDGPTLDSANALDGRVRFTADAGGTRVVAAQLGEPSGPGVVFDITSATSRTIPSAQAYVMLPNGKALIYRNAQNDLISVSTSTAAPTVLAKGVLGLLGINADGTAVLFNKTPRDPATSFFDVNIVTTLEAAPAPRLLTAKGLALGFTGDSKSALYLDGTGASVVARSIPVSGDTTGRELVKDCAGGRSASLGTGFIAFTNIKNGTATSPTVAQISYVDAARGGDAVSLATDVPLAANDTELFMTGNRVVFTDLAVGKAGIYAATLP
ncbi:MAG: hypothetical protein U0270_34230 [Labilithrix sp.]